MGRVYAIICYDTGAIYVGSTQTTLDKRIKAHVKKYNEVNRTGTYKTKSYDIINRGQYDIMLLEEVAIETDEELRIREQRYLNKHKCFNLLNKYEAYLTPEEYKIKFSDSREKPIICECGIQTTGKHISRHRKTNRHAERMKEQ